MRACGLLHSVLAGVVGIRRIGVLRIAGFVFAIVLVGSIVPGGIVVSGRTVIRSGLVLIVVVRPEQPGIYGPCVNGISGIEVWVGVNSAIPVDHPVMTVMVAVPVVIPIVIIRVPSMIRARAELPVGGVHRPARTRQART